MQKQAKKKFSFKCQYMASPWEKAKFKDLLFFYHVEFQNIFLNPVFINVIHERLWKKNCLHQLLLNSCNLREQGRKRANLVLHYLFNISPSPMVNHDSTQVCNRSPPRDEQQSYRVRGTRPPKVSYPSLLGNNNGNPDSVRIRISNRLWLWQTQ